MRTISSASATSHIFTVIATCASLRIFIWRNARWQTTTRVR